MSVIRTIIGSIISILSLLLFIFVVIPFCTLTLLFTDSLVIKIVLVIIVTINVCAIVYGIMVITGSILLIDEKDTAPFRAKRTVELIQNKDEKEKEDEIEEDEQLEKIEEYAVSEEKDDEAKSNQHEENIKTLRELKEFYDKGIITQQEYTTTKKSLLKKL